MKDVFRALIQLSFAVSSNLHARLARAIKFISATNRPTMMAAPVRICGRDGQPAG